MKIIVLLIFGVLFLVSCGGKTSLISSIDSNEEKVVPATSPPNSCPSISSEIAVLIAKGYMFDDYDLQNREIIVKEESDLWKITLYRKANRNTFGGDPIVWINKSNGEIIRVEHAK